MPLSRSQQMSRIRSRNTRPETVLRQLLWRKGLRYRVHYKTPAGRPDIVFPRQRVAVFVDGCFWHGCPDHYVRPRSSAEFWAGKLKENVRRDSGQTRTLESEGWRVCRIWEHEVFECPDKAVGRVLSALESDRWAVETTWRVDRVIVMNGGTDRERRHLRDLRNPLKQKQEAGPRNTKKWRVPKTRGG